MPSGGGFLWHWIIVFIDGSPNQRQLAYTFWPCGKILPVFEGPFRTQFPTKTPLRRCGHGQEKETLSERKIFIGQIGNGIQMQVVI